MKVRFILGFARLLFHLRQTMLGFDGGMAEAPQQDVAQLMKDGLGHAGRALIGVDLHERGRRGRIDDAGFLRAIEREERIAVEAVVGVRTAHGDAHGRKIAFRIFIMDEDGVGLIRRKDFDLGPVAFPAGDRLHGLKVRRGAPALGIDRDFRAVQTHEGTVFRGQSREQELEARFHRPQRAAAEGQ